MTDFLEQIIGKMGIEFTGEQFDKIRKYHELMVETNKVMNLTSITEYNEAVIKHYADSLALLPLVNMGKYESMIDVGTGAGFPGLILKIACPDIKCTLMDSLAKRVNFLKETAQSLGIKDITIIHSRAEELGRNPLHRDSYDLAVSRAVANLSSLTELCAPFVKVGGDFISYKATGCEQEIRAAGKAIEKLGCEVDSILDYTIPDSDITRVFVKISKIYLTPDQYPRRNSLPTKKPIS